MDRGAWQAMVDGGLHRVGHDDWASTHHQCADSEKAEEISMFQVWISNSCIETEVCIISSREKVPLWEIASMGRVWSGTATRGNSLLNHNSEWRAQNEGISHGHISLNISVCTKGDLRWLLRVPWTARRSSQSILKEINPEYSLEGIMMKLEAPILFATWWEELTHWKIPRCWEMLKAKGEGGSRRWAG